LLAFFEKKNYPGTDERKDITSLIRFYNVIEFKCRFRFLLIHQIKIGFLQPPEEMLLLIIQLRLGEIFHWLLKI